MLIRSIAASVVLFSSALIGQTRQSSTDDPFIGNWKFVADQSQFASSRKPKDIRLRIVLDNGRLREEEETIRADGTSFRAVFIHQYDGVERPLDMSGDTKHHTHAVRWTRVDRLTIERRINHDDGKLFTKERLQLSSDLNTLSETHFRAVSDELPYEALEIFVRQPMGAGFVSGQSESTSHEVEQADRIQQVLAADEARRQAMMHGDATALDSLVADDATFIWGDGTTDNKASMLELFRSGRLHYARNEYENSRVRIFGDTAVVTGDARVQATSDGHAIEYLVRVTRVYVFQQQRWRLVAVQTTRVTEYSSVTIYRSQHICDPSAADKDIDAHIVFKERKCAVIELRQ